MRRVRVIKVVALAAIAAIVVVSVAMAATARVGVKQVGKGFRFTPGTLSIKRGDTVTWSWRSPMPHNVTGPGFHSRTAPRLTFSHRFTKSGTFRVICTIHVATGQKMSIKVT